MGRWKGEELRWAREEAGNLLPGALCEAQLREGRNQVAAGTPFSWEEQAGSVRILQEWTG